MGEIDENLKGIFEGIKQRRIALRYGEFKGTLQSVLCVSFWQSVYEYATFNVMN